MTTVRDQLVAALAEDLVAKPATVFFCASDHAAHLADTTLSLPGVTTIALPAPDSTRYEGDEHEPADRLCWGPGDDFEVSVWNPGEVQRHGYGWGDIEPLSVAEARTIAAWLLAAAEAAEAVKR